MTGNIRSGQTSSFGSSLDSSTALAAAAEAHRRCVSPDDPEQARPSDCACEKTIGAEELKLGQEDDEVESIGVRLSIEDRLSDPELPIGVEGALRSLNAAFVARDIILVVFGLV